MVSDSLLEQAALLYDFQFDTKGRFDPKATPPAGWSELSQPERNRRLLSAWFSRTTALDEDLAGFECPIVKSLAFSHTKIGDQTLAQFKNHLPGTPALRRLRWFRPETAVRAFDGS